MGKDAASVFGHFLGDLEAALEFSSEMPSSHSIEIVPRYRFHCHRNTRQDYALYIGPYCLLAVDTATQRPRRLLDEPI